MKARFPLIAALAVTFAPLTASAQAWVSNPDFSEGIGIRTGNLEFHPSVGAEAGYDSNFTRASKAEGPVDVYKLRETLSATMTTLNAKRLGGAQGDIAFSTGAYVSLFQLIPADSANSDIAKRDNAAIGVDSRLNVFPQRKVGFDLLGSYVRAIDAEGNSNDLAGQGFNRDTVRGGAGVTWRPGGGLFEWRAGYQATYNFFENSTYNSLANIQHKIDTRGRWRFLPRTAVLWDSSYSFVRYTHSATQQTGGDAVDTRVGIHGLVTYHLALLGMLAWAASFYEQSGQSIAARQYDSFVANAEARWFIQARPSLDSSTLTSGISSVALGYTRNFANSYYGSFYQQDRGYLDFSMFILGAVAGGIQFGVSRVGFPDVNPPPPGVAQPAFSQTRIDGRVFGEYRFTQTLAVNATFMFEQVNSPPVNNEDLKYSRWQTYLGVRWFM